MRYLASSIVPLVLASGCIPQLYSSGGAAGPWSAPENDWPMSDPPAGLVGEGYHEGQTAPDVRLLDQHGQEVSLWQFYGQVVLFDISTMWCGPCQDIATHTEATYEDYVDDGFMYLTILHEDVHNEPPTVDDLVEWAGAFGITSPVLADGDQLTAGAVTQGQYPAVLVIDRSMKVATRVKSLTDAEIRAAIDDAL
jgi:thiol-disulfide isomerase/thioredoxin